MVPHASSGEKTMNQMIRLVFLFAVAIAIPVSAPSVLAQDEATGLHDDYYFGFSQGAYYGLMLAGEEYDVAWCMKSELEYEARTLGSGSEFQKKLESLLANCRKNNATQQ